MLPKLRNKKAILFSTLLIVFALIVKMLVPIAHASNNQSNGAKSFIASLCINNKIISVNFDLSSNGEPQSESVSDTTTNCPLCSIAEHTSPPNEILDIAIRYQQDTHSHTPYQALFVTALYSAFPIRAPPNHILI